MGTHRYLRIGETGDTFPGIPAPVFIVAAVFVVGTVFLTRTRDGIRLMAVGGNAEAVRRAGIHSRPLQGARLRDLRACSPPLGGLVNTANVTEANPAASPAIIFTALTAVALAGVALTGGRGSLPRVLVGALILATIANGLTIRGIQPYWATVATGALLLGSLLFERVLQTAVSERLMSANLSVHAEAGLSHDRTCPPARRALELTDIELHYGFVRALDGIDMHVMPGEVVALLGDNGAGKSTLLKVMSGAHKPSHGTHPRARRGAARSTRPATRPTAGIQMVYQDLALVEPQDISTNLNMGQEQLRRGPLGWLGFVDRKAMRKQLRGRARPARRPYRPDDPAGRDALRRPAPGRGPRPQRDPRQRRVAGHPAARRADRRARLRADQERRGADPPDGRPGHRDRARHPRPPALLRGGRPDRHPQPRQEGRRRARRRHRPRPRRRLDHRLPRVACSPSSAV